MATVKKIHRVVGTLATSDTNLHTVVSCDLAALGLTGDGSVGVDYRLVGTSGSGAYGTLIHVAACLVSDGGVITVVGAGSATGEIDGKAATGIGTSLGTASVAMSGNTTVLGEVTAGSASAADWFGILELIVYQPA